MRQFRVAVNPVNTHFRQVEQAAGPGGAQVWAPPVVHDRPGPAVTALARAPAPLAGGLPDALDALGAAAPGRLEQDLGKLTGILGIGSEAGSLPLAQL